MRQEERKEETSPNGGVPGAARGDLPDKAISGSSAMSPSPKGVPDGVCTGPEVPVQSNLWEESKGRDEGGDGRIQGKDKSLDEAIAEPVAPVPPRLYPSMASGQIQALEPYPRG